MKTILFGLAVLLSTASIARAEASSYGQVVFEMAMQLKQEFPDTWIEELYVSAGLPREQAKNAQFIFELTEDAREMERYLSNPADKEMLQMLETADEEEAADAPRQDDISLLEEELAP